MTKDDLIKILLTDTGDEERDHACADDALLAFINDVDITKAFWTVGKWYA